MSDDLPIISGCGYLISCFCIQSEFNLLKFVNVTSGKNQFSTDRVKQKCKS